MAEEHIQVTGGIGFVGGFDNGTAGVVDIGTQIGQLDEILKIFEGGFAAAALNIVNKGWAVDWGESHAIPPDGQIILRVARQLSEFAWGFRNII